MLERVLSALEVCAKSRFTKCYKQLKMLAGFCSVLHIGETDVGFWISSVFSHTVTGIFLVL